MFCPQSVLLQPLEAVLVRMIYKFSEAKTRQTVTIMLHVYLLAKFEHQLLFPGAVSMGHLIYKAYTIGDHV